jgi:hypothetical protein
VKKLLLVLLCLPLLFNSCKKESNNSPLPLTLCCCGGELNGPYLNIEQLGYGDFFMYIPNAFTPNNDGVNDLFSIIPNSHNAEITIHRAPLPSVVVGESWDGTLNNTEAKEGIYNYTYKLLLPDTTYIFTGGKVSLIRDLNNNAVFNNFPSGVENCTFGDQIDPQYGFIYPTNEDIVNWGK